MTPWHVLLAALLTQIATAAIPTLAPFLQADLGLSKTQVGLINSTVFLGFTLGAVPGGWLTDRVGNRLVLIGGTAGAGALAVAIGLVGGGLALLVAVLVLLYSAAALGWQGLCLAGHPRRAAALWPFGGPVGGLRLGLAVPDGGAHDRRLALEPGQGTPMSSSASCSLVVTCGPLSLKTTLISLRTPKLSR